jgi:hypothetical protein
MSDEIFERTMCFVGGVLEMKEMFTVQCACLVTYWRVRSGSRTKVCGPGGRLLFCCSPLHYR